MKYAKLSSIDTPTQGCLFSARQHKANAWNRVKSLRAALREAHTGPYSKAPSIKLALIIAESAHRDAKAYEAQCLAAIEARANELGLTTRRESAACRGGEA